MGGDGIVQLREMDKEPNFPPPTQHKTRSGHGEFRSNIPKGLMLLGVRHRAERLKKGGPLLLWESFSFSQNFWILSPRKIHVILICKVAYATSEGLQMGEEGFLQRPWGIPYGLF